MATNLHLLSFLLLIFISCADFSENSKPVTNNNVLEKSIDNVEDIPLPQGFGYGNDGDSLYTNWLLNSGTCNYCNGSCKK